MEHVVATLRKPISSLTLFLACCLALPSTPVTLTAQDGTFIVRLGTDTIGVERFSRSKDGYSVEQLARSPRTSLRYTQLELTPGGEIATIYLMHRPIGAAMDAPLLGSTKLTYSAGDSATVETRSGDTAQTRSVAISPGSIPSVPQAWLPYELAAMRLRASSADSMSFTLLGPGGESRPVIVRRIGDDSMSFTLPQLAYRARVDREGRILSLYQPRGTSIERVPDVDVNRLATAWAELDEKGKGMGPLSPLDSVSARVGDAQLAVRYSRPKKRGRVLFGDIVPWDTVWRTGAGAATVLTTDRDLVVGGKPLPAGSYSLFTIPSRSGTTLIINRETMRDGEPLAGTARDPSHDVARVAMKTTRLARPVEQFTVQILPRGSAQGTLRLAWDRREMTVPIRAR
jgi:hypothetical protein